ETYAKFVAQVGQPQPVARLEPAGDNRLSQVVDERGGQRSVGHVDVRSDRHNRSAQNRFYRNLSISTLADFRPAVNSNGRVARKRAGFRPRRAPDTDLGRVNVRETRVPACRAALPSSPRIGSTPA